MILEEATYEAFGYYTSNTKPNSQKPIIAACELCGAFRIITKNGYSTFCHSCAHRNRSLRIKCICKTCEKEFFVSPYRVKNGGGKYCCKKCSEEGSIKLRVKRICQICGKKFEVRSALIEKGWGRYCSHKCFCETRKNKIVRICQICGKKFEVVPSKVANGKGKYCCKKCTNEGLNGVSNPSYGKYRGKKSPRWKGGWRITHARASAKRKRELGYSLLAPLKKDEAGHHVTNEHVIGVPKVVHVSFTGHSTKKHRTLVLQWLKANDKKKYMQVLCVLAREPLKNKDIYTNTSKIHYDTNKHNN